MSLNRFTSQASAQPYLNLRVQSLVVDGKITTYNVPSTYQAHGVSFYYTSGAGYSVVTGTTYTTASANATNPGGIGNVGASIVPSGLQLTQALSPYYSCDATITFANSATTSNLFTAVIGTSTYVDRFSSSHTCDPTTLGYVTLSMTTCLPLGEMDIVTIGIKSATASSINVKSWTIRALQLPSYTAAPSLSLLEEKKELVDDPALIAPPEDPEPTAAEIAASPYPLIRRHRQAEVFPSKCSGLEPSGHVHVK